MKQFVTLKGFIQSEAFEKLFGRRLEKLNRILKNFVTDMPKLTLHMKKHDKNHFYSGVLMLKLPKKSLIAHIEGHKAEAAMIDGFERIHKELEKYKGTHFKGSSKYPNRSTIRKLTRR